MRSVERHPVVVTEGKLTVASIPRVCIWSDPQRFLERWDNALIDPQRFHVIVDPQGRLSDRFPVADVPEIVDKRQTSEALFEQPEAFRELLPTQDRIWRLILKQKHKDVIVLIIVDGLSFDDCVSYGATPCLAPGATLTSDGYLRVAGNGKITRRLFDHGFFRRIGFTPWSRDKNELTDSIFRYFEDGSIHALAFNDALEVVARNVRHKTYIQIVMAGLDSSCHHSTDQPLRKETVRRIFSRLSQLEALLKAKGLSASLFLTADHGILWREDHSLEPMHEPRWSREDGVRYLHGHVLRDYLKPITYRHFKRSVARYPFILRKLRATEWGVHGGISYEESIVPLHHVEV